MKAFRSYLTELAWQQSTSKMVFGWNSFDYVMLPLSPSILGRIMEQTRDTCFHVLGYRDIGNLKSIQGKKKSISAFFRGSHQLHYAVRDFCTNAHRCSRTQVRSTF